MRTRELRSVRRLAQEVLLQRSEVEAFLVSSIQLVRAQLAAEAAAGAAGAATVAPAPPGPAAAAAVGGGEPADGPPEGQGAASSEGGGCLGDGVAPDTSGSPAAAAHAAQGSPPSCTSPAPAAGASPSGAGVDIRALSWQDRERVLRLLFSKINRAAAQVREGGLHAPCMWSPHVAVRLLVYSLHPGGEGFQAEPLNCAPPSAAAGAPAA